MIPDMAGQSEAARKLKELRKRSGLSVREVADKLGKPSHSSYSHYEDGYKKATLPADLIAELVPILTGTGRVSAKELWDLTAAPGDISTPPKDLNTFSTSPKTLLRNLTEEERKKMQAQLIKDAALKLLARLSIEDRLDVLGKAISEPEQGDISPHPSNRVRP